MGFEKNVLKVRPLINLEQNLRIAFKALDVQGSTWLSLDPIVSNKKDVINSTKEAYHNQAPKSHSFR